MSLIGNIKSYGESNLILGLAAWVEEEKNGSIFI